MKRLAQVTGLVVSGGLDPRSPILGSRNSSIKIMYLSPALAVLYALLQAHSSYLHTSEVGSSPPFRVVSAITRQLFRTGLSLIEPNPAFRSALIFSSSMPKDTVSLPDLGLPYKYLEKEALPRLFLFRPKISASANI